MMISTTLPVHSTILEKVSGNNSRTFVRKSRRRRDWTLLLVFVISPLIMLTLGVAGIVALMS